MCNRIHEYYRQTQAADTSTDAQFCRATKWRDEPPPPQYEPTEHAAADESQECEWQRPYGIIFGHQQPHEYGSTKATWKEHCDVPESPQEWMFGVHGSKCAQRQN
jgi:hypothetical protein